jgi:hypothetical protein
VLFAILQWRSIFSWHQLPLLMATVMIVSLYDSGLYHIPSMNWGKNSAALSASPMQASEVISRIPFNPRSLRCLRNSLHHSIGAIVRAKRGVNIPLDFRCNGCPGRTPAA